MNNLYLRVFIIIFLIGISKSESIAQLTGGWIIQQNPTTYDLNDVKFFDIDIGLIVGDTGTILKTTNSGNNWLLISSGTTKNLNSISLTSTSVVYVAGDSGIILKSTDSGSSWTLLSSQTDNDLTTIVFKTPEIGFAAGKKGTILRTSNSGINWVETFSDTTVSFNSMCYVNNNFIWALGQRYSEFSVGTPIPLKSTDIGLSWNETSIDIYEGTSIFFLDTLNGFALNCSTLLNLGILRTTNGGLDWNCEWGGFNDPSKIFFVNQSTGYSVGRGFSNHAINKTTDSGFSWYFSSTASIIYLELNSVHFVNPEIGWTVGRFVLSPSNLISTNILKTTNGGGFLTNVIKTTSATPSEFRLVQNYPNPFNPSTRISFHINVSSFIVLSVYNSEGRKIETLHESNLNAGSYEITFDGSNYPSGVYYYKLEADGNSLSKKMLLLK